MYGICAVMVIIVKSCKCLLYWKTIFVNNIGVRGAGGGGGGFPGISKCQYSGKNQQVFGQVHTIFGKAESNYEHDNPFVMHDLHLLVYWFVSSIYIMACPPVILL